MSNVQLQPFTPSADMFANKFVACESNFNQNGNQSCSSSMYADMSMRSAGHLPTPMQQKPEIDDPSINLFMNNMVASPKNQSGSGDQVSTTLSTQQQSLSGGGQRPVDAQPLSGGGFRNQKTPEKGNIGVLRKQNNQNLQPVKSEGSASKPVFRQRSPIKEV
jgi:hypothetical protein